MKAIIPAQLRKRTSDQYGYGHFGAPRGTRTHNGQDYKCPAGCAVLSPCSGEVTKLGYPYADDLSFRYVQITKNGRDHRIFYVFPWVAVGEEIEEGREIGSAQDLEKRYPGITPHIHYEIRENGEFINPEGEENVS
jgi:murein DD-endopeptidase MepM/ murein hydrolase activator NlpD